jgi:ABC-type nitrate/sulfonate/bicarbonate transport system substrate-binding protein
MADRAVCGGIIGAAHALLSTTLRLSSSRASGPPTARYSHACLTVSCCCCAKKKFDARKSCRKLDRTLASKFARKVAMKLAVPDMISNSYFPAEAAVELGFFKAEGLDVALELIFPVDKAYAALRDGAVDFVGGSAHSALAAFPDFRGVKLICAQAQGMYWFLVMHADLKPRRGDVSVVKGRSIGAAPWVDKGLRGLLAEAGIDIARDQVTIAPVPGAAGAGINFGVTAAKALEERKIDGFWANGMGAEVAVRRGVGSVVLDVRRGDGPKRCFDFTAATIATTDALIARSPHQAAAAVRAIVRTQAALRSHVERAGEVGKKLFPPSEAALITELIRRDLPYYDAALSPDFVTGMTEFARGQGLLARQVAYSDVVATQFAPLWKG